MKADYEREGVRLYRADCRDVLVNLPFRSVDLVLTDPPYGNDNHDGDWNERLNEHRGLESRPILNDDWDNMRRVVDEALDHATRALAPASALVCFGGGGGGPAGPTFVWPILRLNEKGLKFFHSVVWDKLNPGVGQRFRRQYEMVHVAYRADGRLAWRDPKARMPNVVRLCPPKKRHHPNEKPVKLLHAFVRLFTHPGDAVCDPFMGSGSTAVACVRSGRAFVGMELDPEHFDTAVARVERAFEERGLLDWREESIETADLFDEAAQAPPRCDDPAGTVAAP